MAVVVMPASVSGGARDVRIATGAGEQVGIISVWAWAGCHVSDYTLMVFEETVRAMAQAQRDLGRAVYPREVMVRLPYRRAEGTVRRDMALMWELGLLERIGGEGARQGYRVVASVARSVRYGRVA